MPIHSQAKRLLRTLTGVAVAAVTLPGASSAIAATATPDPFYEYTDSTPLSSYAPGTVLKTRTITYRILGLATPLKATQLLYRSVDVQMRPVANVTTVVKPSCLLCLNKNKVVSYQSFYDSLNPEDSPSRSIAGGKRLPDLIPGVETALFAPFLIQGYTIIIPDGIKIVKMDIEGKDNYTDADAYLGEINGTSYDASTYVFPKDKSLKKYTVEFDSPVEHTLTFTPKVKQCILQFTLYTETSTGIQPIAAIAKVDNNNIYDLSGRMVKLNAKAEDLQGLKKGIYIYNNKKYVAK